LGGQTPLNIAAELEKCGVKIIGTTPDVIDLAEDRDRFRAMMRKLGVPQPESGMVSNLEEALLVAGKIGYPLMVRPSYVLGAGQWRWFMMRRCFANMCRALLMFHLSARSSLTNFLKMRSKSKRTRCLTALMRFVPAVMEHIELAGIHSGDSACVIPPVSIPEKHIKTIEDYTRKIAIELGVKGLINIQYAIANDKVYILEANPRASRTVPLVSKVCNISMARIGTQIMLGKKLKDLNLKTGRL